VVERNSEANKIKVNNKQDNERIQRLLFVLLFLKERRKAKTGKRSM